MKINLPDIPAVYEMLNLSRDDQKRDTVESEEWIEKAVPELDSLIRDYNAVRKYLDNELSRAELARECINRYDARYRLERIKPCAEADQSESIMLRAMASADLDHPIRR